MVTGTAANVTAYVQRGTGWVAIGRVANVTGVAVPVTVRTDVLVTVDPEGVPALVAVEGGTLLTDSTVVPTAPAGDGVYAVGAVGFVGSLRSVPRCAPTLATSGRSSVAEVVVPRQSTATSVIGWDPSTVAVARLSLYMIPSAAPKMLLPRILPGVLAISNAQYTALTFVIRNFYTEEGSPNPTAPYWNQLRMAIATALNTQDPSLVLASSNAVEAQRRVSLALALDYSYSAPQSLPVGVYTSIKTMPSSLVEAIATQINAFLEGRQQTNTAFTTNATIVSVDSGAVAQRVDVLVYARAASGLTIIREIVRDEYQAYALAAGDVSDIITISEVYAMDGGGFPATPAPSPTPAIAEGAASVVWALGMVAASVAARRRQRVAP